MKALWNITIDDYFNVVKICQELGMKPGDDMEPVFIEYMKMKGQKPFGHTELNKEELLVDFAEKNKNILSIETDSQGKQSYKVIKKSENPEQENNDLPLDNDL
jgi:hypothetical protein